MSLERARVKPIVIAEKLSLKNVVLAILDSSVMHTRIHIGTLDSEGKTVYTHKHHISVDNCQAEPGDKVVTHEV